ncbi:phage tail assembly chaperone [Pseudomonas entomophila]
MAKIKIAQNLTLSAAMQMPRIGGEPVEVQFEFRYLDRLSWRR